MSGWSNYPELPKDGAASEAVAVEKPSFAGKPTRPTRQRLHSVHDIKRQIRALFFEVRAGELASSEASRLVYILTTLANLMVDAEIENRVSQIERRTR